MDRELNKMFEDYDIDAGIDEERYRANAQIVSEKFEKKMAAVGKKLRFAEDLMALFRYFMDQKVAWQRKVIIVAAIIYFIAPIDTIPDFAPFVGYLDDFGVIAAVTKFMSDELTPYYS